MRPMACNYGPNPKPQCILYDDRLAFNSREFKDTHVQLPQVGGCRGQQLSRLQCAPAAVALLTQRACPPASPLPALCQIWSDRAAASPSVSPPGLRAFRLLPLCWHFLLAKELIMPTQANIGLLYFKASAAVVRCVYSWVWSMHVTAADDPMLWDQVWRSQAAWDTVVTIVRS